MKLTTEDTEDTERATPETHEFYSKCDWNSPAAIRMAELERERDELREAWYQMQSSFERSRDEVERVIRERDEAREAFVIATDQMVIAQGKVREANKERDEALEALMKIEDVFVDGEDTYEDWRAMGNIARAALEGKELKAAK